MRPIGKKETEIIQRALEFSSYADETLVALLAPTSIKSLRVDTVTREAIKRVLRTRGYVLQGAYIHSPVGGPVVKKVVVGSTRGAVEVTVDRRVLEKK